MPARAMLVVVRLIARRSNAPRTPRTAALSHSPGRSHASTTSSKDDQFLGGGYVLLSSVWTLLAARLPALDIHSSP